MRHDSTLKAVMARDRPCDGVGDGPRFLCLGYFRDTICGDVSICHDGGGQERVNIGAIPRSCSRSWYHEDTRRDASGCSHLHP